ncbi:MAG: MFS transporter [Sheuella sp.]|nr:MFS transporter [Sheuella sp.]
MLPSPDPTSKKPSASAGVGMLCLLIMLVHITISGGRIAVTLTALNLERSTLEVGILIAVFALLPALFSVKAGQLIDKIGPWKPMRASAIAVIMGALLPCIWQELASLILSAICIGVGHMIFQIAIQRQMGQGTQEEKLRNFSWLSLSMATSGLIGPLVAGISIDHLGHRLVFALLALSPIAGLFGLFRMRKYLLASHAKSTTPKEKRSAMDLLAIPQLRRVFAANMLTSVAWDTHMFVLPIFGVGIGLSATTIGLIISCFAAATIVIRIGIPFIQRHFSPWKLIHITMVAAGLNYLIYPFFTQVWILMVLSFLLGLALGSTQPGILALLQQHAPPGRAGEAFGIRMALINTCQVALPLTFGALGSVIGVMPLFWITALGLGGGRWFTRNAESDAAPSNVDIPTKS